MGMLKVNSAMKICFPDRKLKQFLKITIRLNCTTQKHRSKQWIRVKNIWTS